MSKKPPVPPEQRSPKGPGSDPKVEIEEQAPERENYDEQGRHGNVRQNTTHQGRRQSRKHLIARQGSVERAMPEFKH